MITFLPHPSYERSAHSLDRQRLGKQRVEAWQILLALTNHITGWQNHPATNMWRGYEGALVEYGLAVCREWVARGYVDNLAVKMTELRDQHGLTDTTPPPWLGREDVHRSHRSNLVRKLPAFYVPQFGDLQPEPYVWPD